MKNFKLLFFSLIISLFQPIDANSQIHFGVKGGVNFTKAEFKGHSLSFATRYHFGVLAQIDFTDKLYLQPELLFSQKGWGIPKENSNEEGDMILSYLNLPIFVGFKLNKDISLLTGPELGFKINEKRKPAWDFSDIYGNFDFGLAFGINYQLNSHLGIDLRYVHGLKKLINDRVASVDEEGNNLHVQEIKDGSNRVIQLGLFYTFN